MTEYKSLFLHTLQERGYIHQLTNGDALDALLLEQVTPAYIGFDCTAASLHVGSLVQIMLLRWLQKCGHKPIVLMGGATTKIGDPTGKDEARPPLSDEQIAANMEGIRKVFAKFLKFGDGPTDAVMVNNNDWLSKLDYITLLRDYGRHFSINRMMTMDSVKLRLEREQEMSLLEFNYMIMQAYDFAHLYQSHGVRLQMGGSDQWGNIIGGIELHRRLMAAKNTGQQNVYDPVFGLTTPLMTTASGAKMGKTAAGAVWLNAEMLSAYDYYQFWRNTEDADVGRFLRLFTELPPDEIEGLESLKGAEINEAKKILAFEATKLCHGDAAANEASEAARKLFEQGTMGGDAMPTFEVLRGELETGIPAYALFHRAGLAASGGEARRLIRGGGGKLNDNKIDKEDMPITAEHLVDDAIKLSAGKKQHVRVILK